MVYIPRHIVERLDSLSVYDVAEKLDIDIVRNRALCFLHDDHHPSMQFNRARNLWKCYVCQVGGHSIELVQRCKNVSFQDACIWLSMEFNIPIPNCEKKAIRVRPVKRLKKAVRLEPLSVDEEVLNWIIGKAGLSELAKEFLFEERKYSEEVVSSLNIGSISDADKFVSLLTRTFPRERCLKAGVLMQFGDRLYPVFRVPCLLFPFYDLNGNIRNIQSRYLGVLEEGDTRRFNNCKGLKQLMFNMPILNSSDRFEKIYVAEGVTDCLAFLSEGKKAIALPGAGSFQPEFGDFLRDKTLFIYVDNDKAGSALFEKMNGVLKKIGNSIHNVRRDDVFKDYSMYYLSKLHEKDSK